MRQIVNFRRRVYFPHCLLLCLYLMIIYMFIINFSSYRTKSTTKNCTELNSICCFYSIDNGVLPAAEDLEFSPENTAIFFHETSCRGGINTRQACAVESAARLHPNWQVNLLFSAPVTDLTLRNSSLATLLKLNNVKVARLHIEKYAKDTAVEKILLNYLKKSAHPIEHAADILRIVTLHKFGGVYLDTDSILIQKLDALPDNWIAKQSPTEIASGAMAFSKYGTGRNLTKAILTELKDTFLPDSWSHNGPVAIQRVLERICPDIVKTEGYCDGLKIIPSNKFYPIHYAWHSVYFKNVSIESMEGPYMHHMWNYLTKNLKIEKDSPYQKLAKRFCPSIYEKYSEEFGN